MRHLSLVLRLVPAIILALLVPLLITVVPVHGAPARAGVSLERGWQHARLTSSGTTSQSLGAGQFEIAAGGSALMILAPARGPAAPARLWRSSDGESWQSASLPSLKKNDRIDHLYSAGRLLILTGCSNCLVPMQRSHPVPRLWASADAGIHWRPSPSALTMTALAAGGDGIIGFVSGFAGPLPTTALWTSADGLKWRRLKSADKVFGAGTAVTSVTRSGQGLIAGGSEVPLRPPGGMRAAIWTSRDGFTWKQAPNTGNVFGTLTGGRDFEGIEHLVAGPRGILALGVRSSGSSPPGPSGWASPDGTHWHRTQQLPFTNPTRDWATVAAWQNGFVGFADDAGDSAVWSSPDGTAWARVGSDEVFGGSARVDAATSFGGGVAAVGSFALHPQPSCISGVGLRSGDIRSFAVAALLWTPAESQTAPPPAFDSSDPDTLRLLPSDFPSRLRRAMSPDIAGAYVNLCAELPELGRHRAYLLPFQPGDGVSISIVAQDAKSASSALAHMDHLLSSFGSHTHSITAPARIGDETGAFTVRGEEIDCPQDGSVSPYTAYAVAWRQGAVIGVVMSASSLPCPNGPTGGLNLDIKLARKQLAHLQHPSQT